MQDAKGGAALPGEDAAERIVPGLGSRITLRRLQIFWAVAHCDSLTKAAKQLGISQPSLSQQIASLEESLGQPLFERRSNRMFLTEAGGYVLRKVELVLGAVQKLDDALEEIVHGAHKTLQIAGLNSVLRVLMPPAAQRLQARYPSVNYDLHEAAPTEVLELLYGRRISVGLISATSIAPASAGFQQVPVCDDPYVLAVPERLRLDAVEDPAHDLPAEAQEILNRSIQFAFGTQHTQRVQAWYDTVIPDNWPFTQVRSFELALSMARAGLGVCLLPTLSTLALNGAMEGLRFYRVAFPPRKIVAFLPAHYVRQAPYADLIAALQAAAEAVQLPAILETPPFLRHPATG